MTSRYNNSSKRRAVLVIACVLLGITAATVLVLGNKPVSKDSNGYLPKDVPQTPAASPLASAPPAELLRSDAVNLNIPADSLVGPDTTVTGTVTSPDGMVYYRISDYRRGQIAAGEVSVAPGSPQPFSFKPTFGRVYTKGDPATLDVYVLNANGTEQVTRIPIRLQ